MTDPAELVWRCVCDTEVYLCLCDPWHLALHSRRSKWEPSQEVTPLAFVPQAYWACSVRFSHRTGPLWHSCYSYWYWPSLPSSLLLLRSASELCTLVTSCPTTPFQPGPGASVLLRTSRKHFLHVLSHVLPPGELLNTSTHTIQTSSAPRQLPGLPFTDRPRRMWVCPSTRPHGRRYCYWPPYCKSSHNT